MGFIRLITCCNQDMVDQYQPLPLRLTGYGKLSESGLPTFSLRKMPIGRTTIYGELSVPHRATFPTIVIPRHPPTGTEQRHFTDFLVC